MIFKLVIGPWLGYEHEVCSPDGEHPHVIRSWVEKLDEGKERCIVCTYSPTTIHAVIDFWGKDPLPYERIYFRLSHTSSTRNSDIPLLSIKNREWLAHFAIEDLYIRGEFDDVLKEP